ncbi:exotoxin [Yersinia enterocolitica]|uniref:peptidase inhibitor family I36 protein n=1 Tax=Yersinia enterocolitica TaxID=630 RepID=UPI00083D27DE|nr:peptidase inhibitor family I36 protein [Yersinia enterocolitica]AOF15887.1 exotoxin [Yersinia enterocolitica]
MIENKSYFISALLALIFSFDVFSSEPKVCFFIKENYQGNSLCTVQGNAIEQLPIDWNDKISSIFIPHGMSVTVFNDVGFSGEALTFKKSVESLFLPKWSNLNNSISSFKVRAAACFYESDGFEGESICLSGNEKIDLFRLTNLSYNQHSVLNPLNDRVDSIKVPEDIQVTVYKDNNYSGDYFVLADDFYYDELEKIGMNYAITSIKVSQQEYFICDQHCVVKGIYDIPLGHAFGDYWLDDRVKYKDVLVSFRLSGEDNYTMDLIDGSVIKVIGRVIILIHKNHQENSFIFELSERSDTISFLLRFNGGYSEAQFIESVGTEAVYISPLVGSLFDFGLINANLTINSFNDDNLLIINKVVLTAEKEDVRNGRSALGVATCWIVPMINIYNYIIQGRCNQVDRFISNVKDFFSSHDNKILQVSGTAKPLPKKNDEDMIAIETPFGNINTSVEGRLTHITADMHGGSLTVPATALACSVPMKEQLLPQLRRSRDLTPSCIEWTLNILTDFTLLFGDSIATWNAENFGRVIERILKMGDTGYAVVNSEPERRLVDDVRAHLAGNADNMIHMKSAFNFSQLSYADYLHHQTPEEVVHSPIVAQELPLGRYELALENFHFVETIPRIRREGRWVEEPELHFEIEVISGPIAQTRVAREIVLPVIDEWRQIYHQTNQSALAGTSDKYVHTPTEADGTVVEAASLVSDVAQSWLRTSHDDYIYVVVRLWGKVISITMALDINELDTGIAGSLTNPQYVLHPEAEGAVRGAGTAAIRALADHLSKKGKRALVSDVISMPSAIVKKKVGFKFINEF